MKRFADQSSSGGVFTLLAREVIRRGGVVFGAAFGENMRVEHVGAFDETELSAMRGSKYVQSDATDAIGQRGFAAEKGNSGAVFRHTVPDKRAAGRVG